MLTKLKHIIAVLLLIIFPLSAIGMSITIHKCQNKGTIHFSFFESSNNFAKDCCGERKNVKECELHKRASCCCNNKHSLHETCAVNTDNKNSTSSHPVGNHYSKLTSACCSNSELSYRIPFDYFASDYTKVQSVQYILSNDNFNNFKPNLNSDDLITLNKVRYPLKELIFSIISFIHSTSDFSGNDTEVPKLQYC